MSFSTNYEHGQDKQILTEIKQAITKQKKLVANVRMFESQGITCADGVVHSDFLNKYPRELAFQIESSS